MFSNLILNTPLVGNEFTEKYYSKVRRYDILDTKYRGDDTFLSTLRALVSPRMDENSIPLVFGFKANWTGTDIRKLNPYAFSVGSYVVVECPYFTNDNWDGAKNTQLWDGWESIPIIQQFFSTRKIRAVCFVHKEERQTVLLVDRLTPQKWHYLQCAILPTVPWYFTDNTVSDKEKELIESLTEKTSEHYLRLLSEIANTNDFRGSFIRSSLGGIESVADRMSIDSITKDIESRSRRIMDLYRAIQQEEESKETQNVRLMGLKEKLMTDSKKDGELMQFFLRTNILDLDRVLDDGEIDYYIRGKLEANLDKDFLRKRIANPRDSVYYNVSNKMIHGIKRFLEEVFINETYNINVCSKWRLNIGMGRYSAMSGVVYPEVYEAYYPNPHIQNYGCISGYIEVLESCIRSGDYVSFMENSIMSNSSLNFNDSTVMGIFIRNIMDNYTGKPVVQSVENGNIMSFHDAIKEILEKDKEESGNNGEENTNQ